MEYDKIFYIIGFLITFAGAFLGIFKWVSSQVQGVRDLNDDTRKELNDFKVKASETFATKDNLDVRIDQVLDVLKSISTRLDNFYSLLIRRD
ncbi:hypothetical protein KEU06_08230 [Pseudaminobacter sp. 19-2017]|uniref:Uncharacterized protein n=1 Tax=Pseudaminobacter soli (ex Zhang et al. 2022) TaxID=2831468 RepID=A0A942E0Z6_9HYPH|nr:hypothetical protein [Pseudaminobacter soli]MBS3648615.1 hypothetical protein [Pseudaminobacter soli]